jgi:hypothetical protein
MKRLASVAFVVVLFAATHSTWSSVVLYDPFPIGDGTGDLTYIADRSLSGDNVDTLATTGQYIGNWHWSANFGVIEDGLTYTTGAKMLSVSGGALEKLYGGQSYRNLTLRKYSGAAQTTTYFSGLLRWGSFGSGVDTRFGLGTLEVSLKTMAYLAVNRTGVATARLYGTASTETVQLETGKTYFIVGKLEYDVEDGASNESERLTLWICPKLDLATEPGVDDTDQYIARLVVTSDENDWTGDYIGARADEGMEAGEMDDDPVVLHADEYRIGETWADVTPCVDAVILYDPFPIGDGSNDETYIAEQSLSGDNNDTLATIGQWTQGWLWAANFGVAADPLKFHQDDRQLTTAGGCIEKLYGSQSFRNFTSRRFDGALSTTMYFSGLLRWGSFGSGVDTRFGLGSYTTRLNMRAILHVNNSGVGTVRLYGDAAPGSVQLSANTTYLVVGRVEFDVDANDSERLTLWISPTLTLDEGPASGDTGHFVARFEVTSDTYDETLNYIGCRADEGESGGVPDEDPVVLWVDEYRVGKTYKSVTPDEPYNTVSIEDLLAEVDELDQPLGSRLPVFIWGNPAATSPDHEYYVEELYKRGLAYTANICHMSDAAYERLRIMEDKSYHRGIVMQAYGQANFGNIEHEPPAQQDGDDYPCLGGTSAKETSEQARAANDITKLQNESVEPTVLLFDWENWCRFKNPIDVATHQGLSDRYDEAEICPDCIANCSAYLTSKQTYLNGVEYHRGRILNSCMFTPFRNAFSGVEIGNYYTVSHVRSDQPLGNVTRAVGWHGSGADFSQPVGYGNYLNKLYNPDYSGWNCFKIHLQELSRVARNQVGDEYQLPWTCRVLPGYAVEDDENGFDKIVNGTLQCYAWTRSAYKEYLRHCMLRGAKSFVIFHPNSSSNDGNRTFWLREVPDVLSVFNEMHAYDSILDSGTILNLTDIPGDYYSSTNAVVWSGVQGSTQAVVRAVSFTGQNETVTVTVFGRQEQLTATPAGTTYVIDQ